MWCNILVHLKVTSDCESVAAVLSYCVVHCCMCCVELVKAMSVLWSTDHTLGWAGDAIIGFVHSEVACRSTT